LEGLFVLVEAFVPLLSGLIMRWVAFLSPRWSDLTLWSAAMIFTSYGLALNVAFLFPHTIAGEVVQSYPRVAAVVGLIAYASWLLVIRESALPIWAKRALQALCVIAIFTVLLYPMIDEYTRAIDNIGGIVFAAALFIIGIAVANRVGVNVLGR
jgi:hypothetical protein